MEIFAPGNEFHTYKLLMAAKHRYEQATKTLLTTKKSVKYSLDDPRCEELVYSRITYQCKAGEGRKSTSKGSRAVSSGKKNCPVLVTLATRAGKLVVSSSKLEHANHTQDFETFMQYPENLRLKPDEIRYAKELLVKGWDKATIKEKLKERRGGLPVSKKVWAQINRAMRKNASGNESADKEEDSHEESFADGTFDALIPEVKVKQEVDTSHNTSDDDDDNVNDNDNNIDNDDNDADECDDNVSGDPLSDLFEKCATNDTADSRSNAKLKKDFDNWFKNLIPEEKLSYNEWLWQLEFNFPSLDKLNFIKYGIILGMTILNKYYFDGSMRIDGNGIQEVGAEFRRKRKKPRTQHVPSATVETSDEDDFIDNDNDDFQRQDDHISAVVNTYRVDNEVERLSDTKPEPSIVMNEPSSTSSTSKSIVESSIVEPTVQVNEQISCKMCPEVFPTHSQLYYHMCKYHTGHIGLNCPICNKRFQYERNMNLHIAAVHADNGNGENNPVNIKPGLSICEICGASFDKISSLKSHSRYVHSIEKFFCRYCNRKLSSKKSLKEHIQFQHELTFVTHECEDCQRIFKYKSSYRLHMKKQHGIHFS